MFRKAEAILLDVALRHGVSVELIRSRRRWRTVVRARKEVVARLRRDTDLSWAEIAIVLDRSPKSFRGVTRPVPPR